MKVTLIAVVALTAVASLVGAADPECIYRKIRGLSSHWPKPQSCSTYYRCSSKNTVRTVTCPAGKEYNPKTGKCSNAGRSLCKLSLVAPLAETTNVCSTEVNGAYLAKSGYCAEFYICDAQLAYPQQCDSGSFFNNTLGACEPDTNSDCWQNLCVGKSSGDLLANEENCASYYKCTDEEATPQTCASGSFFNNTINSCTVDTGNSECWVNYCIGKADGSAVADKTDCSKFYVCSNNTATAQECPEDSHFEDNDWVCVPGPCTTESPCEDSTTTTTEPCGEVTTEPPASCDCGDVKNADFVPDEENCRKYFICIDGTLETGDCGKGNMFNANLSVCVIDDNNECSVADCTDGDVKVDPQDCSKYFKCQSGDWTSISCNSGSFFNETLKCCQVDEDNVCIEATTTETPAAESLSAIECNARDPPTRGNNCWSYRACINGQWKDEICTKDYYFDASFGICREDTSSVCPENRSSGSRQKRSVENCTCEGGIEQGSIISHSTDCDKYLICENGQLVEGSCGVGNVFSKSIGVCVPDTKATCWVCSNKPNGYQMPNPTDCTSYLTCWNGVATDHSCGSDEWYNGNGECVVDVNAKCINPCTCGNGNVSNPICTKYYQCTDGVALVVECPAGEAFDSETGLCSATVECSAKNCTTATDGTTYPVDGDTSKFYVCLNNQATIKACPADTAFSTVLGMCESVPSTNCDQSVCETADEYSTYPALNNDSSTFCVCENGGGYIKSCLAGYFYDEAEERCGFTGNCDPQVCVDQTEYHVSPDYEDSNSFCLCRAGEPVAVACPRGYTFDSEELQCVLIPVPDSRCCVNGCTGKADYSTLPALANTDGFCICVSEVPQYVSCPENEQYDSELGACLSTGEETTCAANACEADICQNELDYETFPAASNPSGLCYCLNYCPIFVDCPDNYVYDEKLKMCSEQSDPSNVDNCNAEKCDNMTDYGTYAPNEGLDGFCLCEDGLPTYVECLDGFQYDASLGMCKQPSDGCVTTLCDASKCATLGDDVNFPTNSAEENSTSYCYCDGGEVFVGQCSAEMVFLPAEAKCGVLAASESVCEAGKCTANDDYNSYAALNTTDGFCLCVAGTPVYVSCDEGESYNSNLGACLSASKISALSLCDATRCQSRAVVAATFAAINTRSGYCSCQDVGVSTYTSCADEHVYEERVGACVLEACDYANCLDKSTLGSFEAKNTTEGFCSCDSVPTFHHCQTGQVFDKALGACLLKDALAMISCNLKECLKRGQFEPFAAANTKSGFCSCDDEDRVSVTYHPCGEGKIFDRELGMCSTHSVQKRSLEAEENVRSISLFKKFFPKLF